MTDAFHTVHETPIGDALVVVTDAGLVALHVLDGPHDDELASLSVLLGAVPRSDAAATAVVCDQLDEYFDGERTDFDLDVDWRLVDGFTRAALQAVCDIPYGQTASYGEVAITAGSPGAHRAAGSACAKTPISIVVPAHRVVRSDGSIGEYGGRPEIKRFLLDLEARVAEATAATPGATQTSGGV